ncbi:MAG: DUF2029 domain-containing protein [Deltaproteobacteria bacterium]|nr:MAG: DUF2029 domain-containing protein [Deltaproteobacteria bacterium]
MPISLAWNRRVKAIILGLGLAVAISLSGNWLKIYTDHIPSCAHDNCVADFVIFYAQPLMLRQNPRALYDLDQQLAFQKKFVPTERVLIFPYPPITAALLVPLTLLSFSGAFLAMTVLNIGLIWAILRRLVRDLNLTSDQTQWLLLATLCNFGIQATLFNSHGSIIILYIMTRHVLAQKKRKEIAAGIWAGMLCLKLQYLALPHFVFLLHRAWRGFFTGVLAATVLVGGSFLLLGEQTFIQYLQIIQRYSGSEHDWTNPLEGMHNLRALAGVWLPVPWGWIVWAAAMAIVLLAVVWLNQRARHLSNGFEISWIGNSIALLLLSPHLFTHDLSLLVIPAALLLSICGSRVPVWLGVGLVVVGLLPAVTYLLPTIVAAALAIFFIFSLSLTRAKLANI